MGISERIAGFGESGAGNCRQGQQGERERGDSAPKAPFPHAVLLMYDRRQSRADIGVARLDTRLTSLNDESSKRFDDPAA
ncbi:hypothetical protein NKG94_26845 [Micromonospora sp. M12]